MRVPVEVANRIVPRAYAVTKRRDLFVAISLAIEASGGRILYSSAHTRAPFYFGVETEREERLGLLIYPFRFKKLAIKNRPSDENRGQLRLGSESSWLETHPVAFDVAGVDTTLVLGIDPERSIFIGLDPHLWDPLPLGISFYAKDSDLDAMGADGWHAWQKDNRAGNKRETARSESGLESMVAFRPNRLLDFARLERRAVDLGLDTPLRLSAAEGFRPPSTSSATHILEKQFGLTPTEILEIISTRSRLVVAVRGGVAEYHLERQFESNPAVIEVGRRDRDGEPDFDLRLVDGRSLVVECKNASPELYANGDYKVEVQKTRASKGDPASRYYKVTEFDVVAACLFTATGVWQFRFARTIDLPRHSVYTDRLAPMQRVDETWVRTIEEIA